VLTLYRRHEKARTAGGKPVDGCPHASDPYWKKCQCPMWVRGVLRDVLAASCAVPAAAASLQVWTECKNKAYFNKVIRDLHKARLVEASEAGTVRLLPPGTAEATRIIANHKKK
jgi:hypothetical protein